MNKIQNWFANRTFEQCIKDRILIWHNGGCLELQKSLLYLENKTEYDLYDVPTLFEPVSHVNLEVIKEWKKESLQLLSNHLKNIGCGNILFRFLDGDEICSEFLLNLESVKMTNVIHKPDSDLYDLTVDNDGDFFMRNNVIAVTTQEILSEEAKQTGVLSGVNEIKIP